MKRIRSHGKPVGWESRNLGLVYHILMTAQVALSKPPYLFVLVSYSPLTRRWGTAAVSFISSTLLSVREPTPCLWLCNASERNVIAQCQNSHFAPLGKTPENLSCCTYLCVSMWLTRPVQAFLGRHFPYQWFRSLLNFESDRQSQTSLEWIISVLTWHESVNLRKAIAWAMRLRNSQEVQARPEKLGPQGCRSSSFQNKGVSHHQHCDEVHLGTALPVLIKVGIWVTSSFFLPKPSTGSFFWLSSLHWTKVSFFAVV